MAAAVWLLRCTGALTEGRRGCPADLGLGAGHRQLATWCSRDSSRPLLLHRCVSYVHTSPPYSGDTLRYVHAEVARQPAQAAPQLSRPLLSAARASASPQGSPWPHQQRRQRHLQPQQVMGGSTVHGDVEASSSLVWCETAGRGSWPVGNATVSGGCFSMAAVALAQAPRHLDVEAGICEALRQQRVPPAALVDYAAAPVLACCWAGRDGLLLLTVLRLARPAAESSPHERQPSQPASQPQHRSACVLLHAAADTGAGSVVEWLEPPYPWHHDLSAFLVQQTAFAGGQRRLIHSCLRARCYVCHTASRFCVGPLCRCGV